MTTLYGYVSNQGAPEYDDIMQSDLSPEEKVKQIKIRGQAYRDDLDAQLRKDLAKQYAGAALEIGSAAIPFGAGAKVTQAIAKPLVPYIGRQIAKTTAQGIGAGAVGGGVEGVGRGLIEGENPLVTGLLGMAAGSVFGGLGGLGAGKIGQKLAFNKLLKDAGDEAFSKYFDDYVEGLSNNAPLGKRSLYQKQVGDLRLAKQGLKPNQVQSDKAYNFIGENAQNIDRGMLNKANELFNQGVDNEAIRQQTGWFKGVDDKWRYEIPYGELFEHPDLTEWSDIYGRGVKSYSIKLKDLYDAPELYKNYPEFAEKTVYFDKMPETSRGSTDYEDIFINQNLLPIENPKYIEELNKIKSTDEYKNFNSIREKFNNNEINYDEFSPIEDAFNNSTIGDRYNDLLWDSVEDLPQYLQKGDKERLRRTLIHELQHNIQNREGFALGGDPRVTEDYLRLAGEVEARQAAARSLLRKPGELQEQSPLYKGLFGYDVDPAKQIINFDNPNSFSLSNEDNALVEKLNQMSKDMKSPKSIETNLKKGQEFAIMEGSEPFKDGEQNYILNEITTNKNEQFLKDGLITIELPIYNPQKGEKGYFIHTVIKDKNGYKFKKVRSKDETIFD